MTASRAHRLLLLCAALLTLGAGCWQGSLHAERPRDKKVDRAIDRMWADEIRRVARDGDWIVSRSLTANGDMISAIQFGEKWSHASIVDVGRGTVIEGITPVVREISLEELMARNWYVAVVRPTGLSAEASKEALARARAQLGKPFDWWGFVGYPQPDKWYCTELVYWASGFEESHGIHAILFPNELLDYGEVVYYSGRRDDVQIQRIAAGRLKVGHDTALAGASSAEAEGALEIDP
jgi:hypothetical protein